jgi:hypothetical protein
VVQFLGAVTQSAPLMIVTEFLPGVMLYPLKPSQPDLSVNSSSFMRVEMS